MGIDMFIGDKLFVLWYINKKYSYTYVVDVELYISRVNGVFG